MLITSILLAVAAPGPVAATARNAYSTCLKSAIAEALKQKLPSDGFSAFAHQHCQAQEGSFKSGLAAFNVKNGMSKAAAAEDAQLQIDDYVFSAQDTYADKLEHGDR